MRLRTFIAADMAEAIEAVRRDLGADAIIVSSYGTETGGIEVVAAIETASGHPANLHDLEASLERSLRDRLRDEPAASPSAGRHPSTHPGIAFDETSIAAALDAQGVPADLRDALVDSAIALGSDDAVAALSAALEARFGFEPIPTQPRKPIMLVGLPGSGKTVTVAKLAAGAVIEGATVVLITTDATRAGAAAQGEAYGRLLGLNLRTAENIETLSLLLEEHTDATSRAHRSDRLCFIDTASVNPFERAEFAALKKLTDGARFSSDAEPVLVLSAVGDMRLLSEAAMRFADLGVRRLVATQVDISRRLGGILAAADGAGLALAQISVTPYLAHGLAPMNAPVCARLILEPHDKRAEDRNFANVL